MLARALSPGRRQINSHHTVEKRCGLAHAPSNSLAWAHECDTDFWRCYVEPDHCAGSHHQQEVAAIPQPECHDSFCIASPLFEDAMRGWSTVLLPCALLY